MDRFWTHTQVAPNGKIVSACTWSDSAATRTTVRVDGYLARIDEIVPPLADDSELAAKIARDYIEVNCA